MLAAVNHRHQSGEGQHIDMALLDVQVATLANQAMNFLTSGTAPTRMGNAHPNIVPYQTFPAADGDIILTIGNDDQFARFCDAAGRPEGQRRTLRQQRRPGGEPRHPDSGPAPDHGDEDHRRMAAPARGRRRTRRPGEHHRAGVSGPAGATPWPAHRSVPPADPSVPLVGSPLRLSGSPVRYQAAPPLLGEHTAEVLTGLLGLDATQLRNSRPTA